MRGQERTEVMGSATSVAGAAEEEPVRFSQVLRAGNWIGTELAAVETVSSEA